MSAITHVGGTLDPLTTLLGRKHGQHGEPPQLQLRQYDKSVSPMLPPTLNTLETNFTVPTPSLALEMLQSDPNLLSAPIVVAQNVSRLLVELFVIKISLRLKLQVLLPLVI